MVPPVAYGDRRGVEGGREAVPLFCIRDDVGRDDMENGSGVGQLIGAAVEIFGGGGDEAFLNPLLARVAGDLFNADGLVRLERPGGILAQRSAWEPLSRGRSPRRRSEKLSTTACLLRKTCTGLSAVATRCNTARVSAL